MSTHVRSAVKGPRYDVKVYSADGLQHSKTFAIKGAASSAAPRTVARQYGALRAMLQYAVDADPLARNPAAKIKLPIAEAVARPDVSAEALEQLAAVLAPRNAAFMWCGAISGCGGRRQPGSPSVPSTCSPALCG